MPAQHTDALQQNAGCDSTVQGGTCNLWNVLPHVGLSLQHMSNIMLACCTRQDFTVCLGTMTVCHLIPISCNLKELSLQHVTNIMLASARMQMHQDLPSMLPVFIDEIFRRLGNEHFNAQQLSNLLWALAIQQVGYCS